MPDAIGWLSALILIATIGKQVHKQWRSRSSEGVSSWLFVGQCFASLGFTIYSALIRNWVFVVTNAVGLATAIAGLFIFFRNRRLAVTQNDRGVNANTLTPRRVAAERRF